MILIDLYLQSANGPHRDRHLGNATICNKGGTDERGTYEIVLVNGGRGGKLRIGTVTDFPRKSRSAWELLRRALNDLHERGELP